MNILDIGCGRDLKSLKFFKQHTFLGVDIVDNNIFPKKFFIHGNFLTLDFTQKFDLILDNGCFHHQKEKELEKYLKKIHETLSINGHFSCCTWTSSFQRSDLNDKRDNHYYESVDKMELILKKVNLHILSGKKFLNRNNIEMFHFVIIKK